MLTGQEIVAREEGVFRRAEAEAASLSRAIRLANREQRLRRKMDRLAGQVFDASRR